MSTREITEIAGPRDGNAVVVPDDPPPKPPEIKKVETTNAAPEPHEAIGDRSR